MKSQEEIKNIIDGLDGIYDLRFFEDKDPYRVLIRTILSQRTRDENTDKATANLFSVYKDINEVADAPIEEIENMERTMKGAELNKAKEILAYELTKLVHGSEEADKCIKAARDVFSGAGNSENMPTTSINADELENNQIGILTLLVKTGLASSNGEGRRLVQQGGISVNDTKIFDPTIKIDLSNEIIIRKGKKVFHKAVKA